MREYLPGVVSLMLQSMFPDGWWQVMTARSIKKLGLT